MSSSLLLQQYSACFVCLTWMVLEIGGTAVVSLGAVSHICSI